MQLFKVLDVLASPNDQQIIYLSKLGVFPSTDELALEFDDVYQVFLGNISDRQNKGSVNQIFLSKLAKIDFIFNEMSNENRDDFWDISSLNGIGWNQIRELAKETLEYRDSVNV